MKFASATLITLALALGVQSSVLPLAGLITQTAGGHLTHSGLVAPGWPWHAAGLPWHAPVVVGHSPAAVHAAVSWPGAISTAAHAAAVTAHLPAVHDVSALHAGHIVHADHLAHAGHVVHAAHVPAVIAGPASYVAKTRGAVHTAPLAGHLNSVANINVAPAPGTI